MVLVCAVYDCCVCLWIVMLVVVCIVCYVLLCLVASLLLVGCNDLFTDAYFGVVVCFGCISLFVMLGLFCDLVFWLVMLAVLLLDIVSI